MGESIAPRSGSDRGVASVSDFLQHYGVKGMRWGVRKSSDATSGKIPKGELVLKEKLKDGESISIYKKPPPALARFFSKFSESYKKESEAFSMFGLHDKDGKKVGEAAFVRDSKTSLSLEWIGVKQNQRGKGYASAAVKGVVKYAQKEGISTLKLEVPTNAPDARHIYENLGFKGGKTVVDKSDPVFGGLTEMTLNVPKAKVKHADSTEDKWEQDFSDEVAAFLSKHFSGKAVLKHMSNVADFIAHYGVKGMRWGIKRNNPASADSAKSTTTKRNVKKLGIHTVSSRELQDAINRMQLEQNFKRLSVNEKSAVTRWISSTLLEVGKREVQTQIAKKVAGAALKKAATGGVA